MSRKQTQASDILKALDPAHGGSYDNLIINTKTNVNSGQQGTKYYRGGLVIGGKNASSFFEIKNARLAKPIGDRSIAPEDDDKENPRGRKFNQDKISLHFRPYDEKATNNEGALAMKAICDAFLHVAPKMIKEGTLKNPNKKTNPSTSMMTHRKIEKEHNPTAFAEAIENGTFDADHPDHDEDDVIFVPLDQEKISIRVEVPTRPKEPDFLSDRIKVYNFSKVRRNAKGKLIPMEAKVDGQLINNNNIHKFLTVGSEISTTLNFQVIAHKNSGITLKFQVFDKMGVVPRVKIESNEEDWADEMEARVADGAAEIVNSDDSGDENNINNDEPDENDVDDDSDNELDDVLEEAEADDSEDEEVDEDDE